MRGGDGVARLDDDLLEELLDLRAGLLVLRPGHQAAVVEAMEQVGDGWEAQQHAEFLLQDPRHIASPQGADTILRSWRVVEALLQAGVMIRSQSRRASGMRPLLAGRDAAAVVLGGPVLHGPQRAGQAPGDVLSGASRHGEDDGLEASPDPLLGDGLGQILKLLQGMMAFDVDG